MTLLKPSLNALARPAVVAFCEAAAEAIAFTRHKGFFEGEGGGEMAIQGWPSRGKTYEGIFPYWRSVSYFTPFVQDGGGVGFRFKSSLTHLLTLSKAPRNKKRLAIKWKSYLSWAKFIRSYVHLICKKLFFNSQVARNSPKGFKLGKKVICKKTWQTLQSMRELYDSAENIPLKEK